MQATRIIRPFQILGGTPSASINHPALGQQLTSDFPAYAPADPGNNGHAAWTRFG